MCDWQAKVLSKVGTHVVSFPGRSPRPITDPTLWNSLSFDATGGLQHAKTPGVLQNLETVVNRWADGGTAHQRHWPVAFVAIVFDPTSLWSWQSCASL